MALSSPGVEVKVIDESFYTPAAAGSVPLIIVASAENKLNGAGDGIAPGTLKANAGQVYLITSQKDLVDTFGDPIFKTDVNNNPIHAGEQNEYGLQAAYSALGVSNRAFVVRADIDLGQLDGKADEPKNVPENGTYWLDTQATKWGIFEWNDAAATVAGGQTFTAKTPIIVSDYTKINAETGGPAASVGKNGSYAIVTVTSSQQPELTDQHPMTVWYRNNDGVWVKVGSNAWAQGGKVLAVSPHTQVPQWKRTATEPSVAASGSGWIKTTEPNAGARWRVKRYSSVVGTFEENTALLFKSNHEAIFNLDKARGGINIPVGQVYVRYSESVGEFKLYRKRSVSPTSIRTNKIINTTLPEVEVDEAVVPYTFTVLESRLGQPTLSNAVTIEFTPSGSASDADLVAAAINSSGLVNVEASVDSQNRIVITHELGGEIHFADGTNEPLAKLGFAAFNPVTGSGMLNLYADDDGAHDYVASLWEPLVYVAGAQAPTTLTEDGALWYSSVIDEVDMMVHNGTTWVGYRSLYQDTDEQGPFVTATAPTAQRDGSALESNDLWIDTNDIENFPTIYRWSKELSRWLLVDKSDQTTDEGVVFADARWGISGSSNEAGSITDLLTSNYVDFDAPDPALYPRGMMLWNLRRSGFNVKQFRKNYVNLTSDNIRFNDEAMANYYPHRWVTISANQDDGSGSFGRKAQRKVIVQSLQATVNTNQAIRDDESRVFNLLACPGYPELIGEMISLNFDRGLTSFIIGDTPARLTPDATSILEWGTNQRLAVEDNDQGLVSSDEYLGLFYPWGFTSDNFGNNVVVPPSHMMIRTMILNDQVAYPWFAPAGLRRGGITNASSVGYVDSLEGEFKPVALNIGQRDTLYDVKVNPITFITGSGLVNYGQKTRSRGSSALDRINVARLVIHLRRQLSILAKPYIFEPNDKVTRDEVKAAVESLLVELVGQRALYDFLVVCDESNNTPSRIDRNELWIDIAIEPVKAVEFIYIPLRLKNTGEISGL
jgi:hypothetical protein